METHTDNCIFCNIINNKAPCEKIYEDDQVMCIKDINPASTYHYLILPKRHIRNAKELKSDDAELYEKMISTMDTILKEQGLNKQSTRAGFHWPPFNTVHHLHLHVISPICDMSFKNRILFAYNSYWFVNTDYVKSYLEGRK
ncbi:histidine triad nucleotide-binding protein 3-like [Ceratina calcarata]|uniref:Adenosine 5'-monophosphoramidase HINT3 n=1 Tax=Ceratina calcarata TaxID=156304 RepID=A0AAJ7J9H0_9HYME|nr:histidine triad nucleotide-binding protein 3-like [Ceratina calcarata]